MHAELVTTKQSTQQVLPPINAETVLDLWSRLPESEKWSKPVRILQCEERQSIVFLQGEGREIFEVVDMLAGRVLTEVEFPSANLGRLEWRVIWDVEAKPIRTKSAEPKILLNARQRRLAKRALLRAATEPGGQLCR